MFWLKVSVKLSFSFLKKINHCVHERKNECFKNDLAVNHNFKNCKYLIYNFKIATNVNVRFRLRNNKLIFN